MRMITGRAVLTFKDGTKDVFSANGYSVVQINSVLWQALDTAFNKSTKDWMRIQIEIEHDD